MTGVVSAADGGFETRAASDLGVDMSSATQTHAVHKICTKR